MVGIAGILVIFVMVFGGYLLAGGKMGIILKSLPFEMMMIGGAAVGAFLISNDMGGIKHTLKDLGKVFKGAKWKSDDYRDLLCLLFSLIRIARANPVEVEQHIEDPENSSVFNKYPKILADSEAVNLICDTMRSASMNYDDPHQVRRGAGENVWRPITTMRCTPAMPCKPWRMVFRLWGLLRLFWVLSKPWPRSTSHQKFLGKMIGGALVGTFLGVFLAYGLVGPFADKVKTITEEDSHFPTKLIRESAGCKSA